MQEYWDNTGNTHVHREKQELGHSNSLLTSSHIITIHELKRKHKASRSTTREGGDMLDTIALNAHTTPANLENIKQRMKKRRMGKHTVKGEISKARVTLYPENNGVKLELEIPEYYYQKTQKGFSYNDFPSFLILLKTDFPGLKMIQIYRADFFGDLLMDENTLSYLRLLGMKPKCRRTIDFKSEAYARFDEQADTREYRYGGKAAVFYNKTQQTLMTSKIEKDIKAKMEDVRLIRYELQIKKGLHRQLGYGVNNFITLKELSSPDFLFKILEMWKTEFDSIQLLTSDDYFNPKGNTGKEFLDSLFAYGCLSAGLLHVEGLLLEFYKRGAIGKTSYYGYRKKIKVLTTKYSEANTGELTQEFVRKVRSAYTSELQAIEEYATDYPQLESEDSEEACQIISEILPNENHLTIDGMLELITIGGEDA